ncbi:MAG: hypothetical protein QNJ54_21570 [Prochloraceae cyanobacterium]|nr:hypothetical protein [Prochloraceae cyanobacterium]
MKNRLLSLGTSTFIFLIIGKIPSSVALPPPEDIPEEVLRTQIITEARSPIDGQPITAAEYAELRARLAQSKFPTQVNPKLQELILLLKVRKLINTIVPF